MRIVVPVYFDYASSVDRPSRRKRPAASALTGVPSRRCGAACNKMADCCILEAKWLRLRGHHRIVGRLTRFWRRLRHVSSFGKAPRSVWQLADRALQNLLGRCIHSDLTLHAVVSWLPASPLVLRCRARLPSWRQSASSAAASWWVGRAPVRRRAMPTAMEWSLLPMPMPSCVPSLMAVRAARRTSTEIECSVLRICPRK